MKISVKVFAKARDIVGSDIAEVELPADACIRDLRSALCKHYPGLSDIAANLHMAVDNNYAGDDSPIPPTADIACFPPVSGG